MSEFHRDIFYDGICVGERRLDLLVEDKILVELKNLGEMGAGVQVQILNNLRVFDIEVGLLLNFGQNSLEFKRFISTRKV